jgi:2,6-dihydroxypyridine 3-monooxygenase
MVPDALKAEIQAVAAQELHPCFAELVQAAAEPFIQVIRDVAVPRMAFGRACLLGDAAFVLRPHPAAASAKAAADAASLSAALAAHPGDPDAALRAWETQRLEQGHLLLDLAVTQGRRSVNPRDAAPTLADAPERFHGISLGGPRQA